MNINDYTNHRQITIAEYKVAIAEAKTMFLECIKRKDTIGALEATKLRLQLQNLLNRKNIDGTKNRYLEHKRT